MAEGGLYSCCVFPAAVFHPIIEDETLTVDSERFHRRLSYVKVGEFQRCGYHFRRWYNMNWMEKSSGNTAEVALGRFINR